MTNNQLQRYELLNVPDMPELRFGALHLLFEHCRSTLASLLADAELNRLPKRFCIKASSTCSTAVTDLCDAVRDEYEIDLAAPFENVATIAGGIWLPPAAIGKNPLDGLLKLRFEAGTSRLPLHAHEHSERLIFVISGSGTYHVSPYELGSFQPKKVRSVPVSCGDMLVFSRGVIHTFETQGEDLILLSYHSPFIALDDPKQFTVVQSFHNPFDEQT